MRLSDRRRADEAPGTREVRGQHEEDGRRGGRYGTEKKDIEREARKAEGERDVNRKRDPYFDFAEALLQISIVTASIAILSSSRQVFYFSLVVSIIGAILSFNGFFMLFHLPFLH